jgi:hypothetical protein
MIVHELSMSNMRLDQIKRWRRGGKTSFSSSEKALHCDAKSLKEGGCPSLALPLEVSEIKVTYGLTPRGEGILRTLGLTGFLGFCATLPRFLFDPDLPCAFLAVVLAELFFVEGFLVAYVRTITPCILARDAIGILFDTVFAT